MLEDEVCVVAGEMGMILMYDTVLGVQSSACDKAVRSTATWPISQRVNASSPPDKAAPLTPASLIKKYINCTLKMLRGLF